jgi:hypothetical protein
LLVIIAATKVHKEAAAKITAPVKAAIRHSINRIEPNGRESTKDEPLGLNEVAIDYHSL